MDTQEANSQNVLMTAAEIDSESLRKMAAGSRFNLMELPLERYVPDDAVDSMENDIENSETIVYSHKRNAYFFMHFVEQQELLPAVKNCVNLVNNRPAAEYLEERGIPAIYSGGKEPIQLVEFLLRFRRTGPVLYPRGNETREEIPGFLNELDIPVKELSLYKLEGPTDEELASYRERLAATRPDIVVLHNRRSVTRTIAAFPGLDFSNTKVIAGSEGAAKKLEEENIKPDSVAEGNWDSIFNKVSTMVE